MDVSGQTDGQSGANFEDQDLWDWLVGLYAGSTMSPAHSKFLFTTCQVGAEATLKEEIARIHSDLRPSYSRPGFITFKRVDEKEFEADFELGSIFARSYGLSLKKISPKNPQNLDEIATLATTLQGGDPTKRVRLHVFERDSFAPDEEPRGFVPGANERPALETILSFLGAKSSGLFLPDPVASPGDPVLDVVVVEENEWWIGTHEHGPDHSPFPGGKPKIELPAEAPSRAFLKLEEGVLWSGAPLKRGDTAVEIGSAPGGASYALLKRGLRVVGIDPADMDPRVLASRDFIHIQRPVASVLREELPDSVEWLLLDMNVTPQITVFQVDRLATRLRNSLLGVLLTLKLNEWKIAREIPPMLEHLRAMGMVRLRARQLASNKREILVYGLTRKGVARLKTKNA